MLYDCKNYKDFLNFEFDTKGSSRGLRSKLATYLNCQTGYISQILRGSNDFTLEHCFKISLFLELSSEEEHFFMLLVQKDRASTEKLKNYFVKQIQVILRERKKVKTRIKVDAQISEKDYLVYYSSWYYAAVHVLTSIPEYQEKKKIAQKLNLTVKKTLEILSFLVGRGLVDTENNKYKISSKRIHLERESPMITQHHTNWRLEAIKSVNNMLSENLHYSGVVSLSLEDFKKIKELILNSIGGIEKILAPSQEEELCCINFDFFKMGYI